jgi:hypothetical protein
VTADVPPPPALRLHAQRPDPRHFWIAWRPEERALAGEPRWRMDLAAARLVRDRGRLEPWRPEPGAGVDDAVYVPPTKDAATVVEEVRAMGAPVVVQVFPGEAAPTAPGEILVVVDLTEAALADGSTSVGELPSGAFAAWPLLPGPGADRERFAAVCAELARRGARGVRALALELSGDDRRALAARREDAFDAVFHRPPFDEETERACAEIAARAGLATTPPRPLPVRPANRRLLANRRVAEALARAAESARRAGEPEMSVEALRRAQRLAEATPYDLGALARDGNLALLDWLDENGRAAAESALAPDPSA